MIGQGRHKRAVMRGQTFVPRASAALAAPGMQEMTT